MFGEYVQGNVKIPVWDARFYRDNPRGGNPPTENTPRSPPAPTRGSDPNRPTTWGSDLTLTDLRGGELSEN